MNFTSEVISLEHDGAVTTLWLDNPDRRNAMGPAFWADLPAAMEILADEADVRAVVLAAKGTAFTVGLDLKSMGSLLVEPHADGPDAGRRRKFYREIRTLQAAISSVAPENENRATR